MYTIGYDVGSSSIKACLLDIETNQVIASGQYPKVEMPMIALQPGWAEQKPEMWWDAIVQVTSELSAVSGKPLSEVKAIGISYQMHGLVVVDKDLQVLRPSIIWCDSRAVPFGRRAFEELGEVYCQQNLLNSPGNFTAAKLAWIAEHERSIYESVHKIMLPGDYIAMKLSGATTTTYSGLSEGIFYDFQTNDISHEVMDYFGFSDGILPNITPTFGEQCYVSKEASQLLGLREGIPISYRAGDQPNNALSLNVLKPGELAATAGTSGVVYGVSDQLKNDPYFRVNSFAHVNHNDQQKRLGVLLCINGTGILNAWMKRTLSVSSYPEMNTLASNVPIGSDGLTILPFGNGSERILKNNSVGSSVHGISFNTHNKGHMVRATQEGIACSFRYGLDIMREMGIQPEVIRAGRANLFLSGIFQEAIANLSGATIELYETDGAQGAARGAGIGLGVYNQDNAFQGLEMLKEIKPDTEQRDQYETTYNRWLNVLSTSI